MSGKPSGEDDFDIVLQRFRAVLQSLYGDRLQKMVLFGFRARGDHKPDGDYDIAVFLDRMQDQWQEFDRLDPVIDSMFVEYGAIIRPVPCHISAYEKRTPLMHEIRKDGVVL